MSEREVTRLNSKCNPVAAFKSSYNMNNFLCKSSINGENFQSIMFSFYCLVCSTSYGHVFMCSNAKCRCQSSEFSLTKGKDSPFIAVGVFFYHVCFGLFLSHLQSLTDQRF